MSVSVTLSVLQRFSFYSVFFFLPILIFSFSLNICIFLVGRVLANGPGSLGSISGRAKPKTQRMMLDTALLNIQHYKV